MNRGLAEPSYIETYTGKTNSNIYGQISTGYFSQQSAR